MSHMLTFKKYELWMWHVYKNNVYNPEGMQLLELEDLYL